MGLARITYRLTRRRVQLTFFSTLAVAFLLATAFLAWQVFTKLEKYAAASQDNVSWSLARLEVEQLRVLSALRDLAPDEAESFTRLHRRFDALLGWSSIISIGPALHPVLEQPRAQRALAELTAGVAEMAAVLQRPNAGIYRDRDALRAILDTLSPPIRQLESLGIASNTQHEQEEYRALASKLLQVTVLSLCLLLALLSLSALLWQLYRLYRQRALENRQTLNRLATILDTSQDAVLVVRRDGEIIDTNRAANAMFFGGTRPEVTTQVSDVLLRKGDDGALAPIRGEDLMASCDDGPNLCANVMARSPSGDVFPVELSADTALRGGQQVSICFVRNIANRLADQAALLAAHDRALSGERARARFLSMISHEMRTPLTGMLGALELLDDTAMSAQQRGYAQIMQSSGKMLLSQIEDALDMAQADQGNLSLSESVFDIDDMLDTLLRDQLPLARKARNRLVRIAPPTPLGRARGDRDRVHQVLLNLVFNAIKFTTDGQITIAAARLTAADETRDMVEFRISDTGIGIPRDAQARIFEDFVRLGNANAHSAEGTGLGLGIVRSLVVLMGGEIEVESAPGAGSLFRVCLPLPEANALASPPVAARWRTGARPVPTGPCDVLVVEDNGINRKVLAEMLEKDGHRVCQAGDGAQGVAQAETTRFDVILMDINMPVLNGIEAARRIRAGGGASAGAQIIALTAYAAPYMHSCTAGAGMDAVLTKPLGRDDLARALDGLAAPPVAMSGPLLNHEVLTQLRAHLGNDTLTALLDGFETQGAALIADLPDVAGEPCEVAIARLHDLAGLAATVGARNLHAALSEAEAALHARDRPRADAVLRRLPGLWRGTLAQIIAERSAA